MANCHVMDYTNKTTKVSLRIKLGHTRYRVLVNPLERVPTRHLEPVLKLKKEVFFEPIRP